MRTAGRERDPGWRARLLTSARGRATVITAAVSALILALVFVLLMLLGRDYVLNRVLRESEETVERVVTDVARGQGAGALVPRPDETRLIQVVGPDGRVHASSPALRGRPALAAAEARTGRMLVDRRDCPAFLDECVWVFGVRLRTSPWGEGVLVIAAAPLPDTLSVWVLPTVIAVVMAGLLVLITWWTWHTIGRVFVPIDGIRAEMADFSERGLDHRVPVPQTGGEVRSLAETVNSTLARLQEATDRERRFVSDASHDLRNPIAGLRTRLEVLLDEPADTDWKPAVRAALRDTGRLNDIVSDLLELSRLDARSPVPEEPVDLAGLVRRELDRRTPRVPVATRLEPDVVVLANPVRLARVLGNLLSNAERHAVGRIDVTVARDGDDAVLEVLDDGAGVPAESRERVFERFARLPESRARDPQGTGLGLPIAREIAEVYGGTLRILDSPRGARFVLRLPAS
ncbi:sensor histidine kinase [Actinomadura chibensis]|uniref:sensor histidine kinase n=1 Tax=Actinomadura chibensis TaxID=392828 RepID=UPI000A84345B|nr:HAMP domain-containing sensor histidine kinase [Actinomadura chibensis]